MTTDRLGEIAAHVSNWGRWGSEDELGTLNFITSAKRLQAARSVSTGHVYSLAIPLGPDGPQDGRWGRTNPLHTMTATGCDVSEANSLGGGAHYTDDRIEMPLQAGTQWDALAHIHYDGEMYGGRSSATIDDLGAKHGSILNVATEFVGRSVLLDIARLLGVAVLPPGFVIRVEHLEAAERRFDVTVQSGDMVLIRTGLLGLHDRLKSWDMIRVPQPGVHYDTALWFHDREVAAVASDTSRVEASGVIPGVQCPFHMLALRDMGLHLGEFWYLESLAAACAGDGRWDFLLAAQALPIVGGVGSPINPVAVR